MKNKLISLMITATAFSSMFAGDFISQTTAIFLNGKDIGKIEVLTPVEIVEKGQSLTKIKIQGVVADNYKERIQRSIPNAEVFVVFNEDVEGNFVFNKKLEDDYGEIWHEVSGVYEVDSKLITADEEALYDQAKKIYEESCSACHRLHQPNDFTANQWPASLQGMIDAGYTAIDENSLNLITKYLQHNAKESY